MKTLRWLAVFLMTNCLIAATGAAQQVAAYGTFSASIANENSYNNTLYGATTGILLTSIASGKNFDFGANIKGTFLHGTSLSDDSVTFGPRVQTPRFIGIRPYVEFQVGFARVSSTNAPDTRGATTDSTIQINGGITRRLTPHLDFVGEFGYSQLYAYGGAYNPKNFSIGAIYYLSRRK